MEQSDLQKRYMQVVEVQQQSSGLLSEEEFVRDALKRGGSSSGSLTFGKIGPDGWEDSAFRRVRQDYDAIPLRVARTMEHWTDWTSTNTTEGCPATRTENRQWYFPLFVSHPWMRKKFVDEVLLLGTEKQYFLLPKIVRMVRYVGDHVCQAILCEARHQVYEDAPPSMRRLFKRFSSFVRTTVDGMVADGASDQDILEHLQDNICVWIDYEVIPQRPHSSHCETCIERRNAMLNSISSIARGSLTILVGCDEVKGASRGWILHEATVSLTSDTVFIWDDIMGEIRPLNLVPQLHRLLDRSAKFTNRHDGHSLRVMQFAMLCLEPNCWFRHAELLFREAGIIPGTVPTVTQWRDAMKHPIHYRIRHEDPINKCVQDKDTRVLCRLEIESILQNGRRYQPHSEMILDIERRSGLNVFPPEYHQDIERACEIRGKILRICFDTILLLLSGDRDVAKEFGNACSLLTEMACLMPQWRLFEGEVVVHRTSQYIRDEWLQFGPNFDSRRP